MRISATDFRSALRHFAAGVAVVTTRDDQGRPCGLTVTGFTSVSLDPPLVLVCVDHEATAHAALDQHGWFAVNVLAKSQEHLSRRFAISGADKFADVAYREGDTGLPVLDDVLAALECRIVQRYAGGDHSIFVGQVEGLSVAEGPPLIYFQGGYHHLD